MGLQPIIGYQIDGLAPTNEQLSGTESIRNVACRNKPCSNFVNIVYTFTADPSEAYSNNIIVKCVVI